jgi:hypothetical protein
MNPSIRWAILALAVAAVAAGVYFWAPAHRDPSPPPTERNQPMRLGPEAKPSPQIQFPLPQAGEAASLPALEQSDSSMREGLAALFGRTGFEALFHPQDIVRRIVATIDNLPREKLALRLMPVRPAAGRFAAAGAEESHVISAENSARYLPFVRLAEAVDTAKLAAFYTRHYPLFQQAYKELGYPSGYFNDRLIEVIDHLLAAPEIKGPIHLAQRKVLYEFADPELESHSAGQKTLIRIGTGNAARVKEKLRDLRREVTGRVSNPR